LSPSFSIISFSGRVKYPGWWRSAKLGRSGSLLPSPSPARSPQMRPFQLWPAPRGDFPLHGGFSLGKFVRRGESHFFPMKYSTQVLSFRGFCSFLLFRSFFLFPETPLPRTLTSFTFVYRSHPRFARMGLFSLRPVPGREGGPPQFSPISEKEEMLDAPPLHLRPPLKSETEFTECFTTPPFLSPHLVSSPR